MDQLLALVLGFVAVHVQGNWLKTLNVSDVWRVRIRYTISFVFALIAGVVSSVPQMAMQDGKISWQDLLANMGIALAASQGYYNTYFRLKNK